MGGPSLPNPAPIGAPPGKSDAEVQGEALAERRRRRSARGSAATILTGSQGVTETANTATKRLLGE